MPNEIEGLSIYPLTDLLTQEDFPLNEVIPEDVLTEVFGSLYYTSAESYLTGQTMNINLGLVVQGEIALTPPGLPGVSLVAASSEEDGWLLFDTSFSVGPEPSARLNDVPIALRVDRSLLQPMLSPTEVDTSKAGVEIQLGEISLTADSDGLTLDADLAVDLPLSMIGETGVLIEASGVSLHFDGHHPAPNRPADWRGIFIDHASLHLPGDLGAALGLLEVDNVYIGSGGFTGVLSSTWTPPAQVTLGGFQFELSHVQIEFAQNALVNGEITGRITVPFFDAPLDVVIGLSLDGSFNIAIGNLNGIGQLATEVLLLSVESVHLGFRDDVFTIGLSGELTPLVEGFDWPTFRIQELSIDSHGNVQLEGGWIDLREQYVLPFSGFSLEISKIGFGSTDDQRRWIGFSGGLKLVDGIRGGASVEGLRLIWNPANNDVDVTLNGVGVEFKVPGAVYFKGSVSMSEPAPDVHRFDGNITLKLESLDLEIEGQLAIGYDNAHDCTFFAIYLGVELPVGIPLWGTGLSLYGMAGLFAMQMEPDRHQDEAWYAIPSTGGPPVGSWYHRGTPGVTDLQKWRNASGALGLGAGVTVGTTFDNGTTVAGRFLLAIAFPGPILFIEGRANLLTERTSLSQSDEPLFRALAVLDFKAGNFLVGLDAQYKLDSGGKLIEIGGSAEALFDFHNQNAWHVFLGVDEPRERRIRAEIFFKLFEANAYFMLETTRLRMGAWVGYDARWKFGPLRVVLQSWLEGAAELSRKPVYFRGSVWLHGKIEVSVFGFGFGLGADARLEVGVFRPFHIKAELSVSVSLPWPFPDFDVTVTLEWGPDATPPLLPVPLKEVAIDHLKLSSSWNLPAGHLLLPRMDTVEDGFFNNQPPPLLPENAPPPSDAPVVPLDARPSLTFARSVADPALIGGTNPAFVDYEYIGDQSSIQGPAKVKLSLTEVSLDRWDGATWKTIARSPSMDNTGNPPQLWGAWAPIAEKAENNETLSSNVKLMLWSVCPFEFTRRTGGAWEEWFNANFTDYPCISIVPDREICADFAGLALGTVLQAPYAFPAVSEFALTWRVSHNPAIAGPAATPTLRFNGNAEARLLLNQDVLNIKLTVQRLAAPVEMTCHNFKNRAAANLPNPYRESNVSFEGRDAGGKPLANLAFASVRTTTGPLSGLAIGSELRITLPVPVSYLDLQVTSIGAPIYVEADDGLGTLVATATQSRPAGETETLMLIPPAGAVIATVRIFGQPQKAYLHSVCRNERGPSTVVATSYTSSGRPLRSYAPSAGVIEIPGSEVGSVVISAGSAPFSISKVCVTIGLDGFERISRQEMARHISESFAHWNQDGEVLPPWSSLRLRVTTTVDVIAYQPLNNSFSGLRTLTQYAYFRTQGPPGLAAYDLPQDHPLTSAPPSGGTSAPAFKSGLEDLTMYVRQTIPPTVPAAGDKPLMPRPVYRAYDVGVLFNENYVDVMYAQATRDLTLYIFDHKGVPVRDEQGLLIAQTNRWGRQDQVTLSASEERWVSRFDHVACKPLDPISIITDVQLNSGKLLLLPETVHSARLIPLLLHEAFAGYTLNGETLGSGGGGRLANDLTGGWTVRDDQLVGPYSRWVVEETGTPPARYIEQKNNIGTSGATRTSSYPGGALLIKADNPHLDAAHPDQPNNWTDYRVSVFVRSADDDPIGVAFRTRGRSGYLFYLDREYKRRRLIRMSEGNATVLAESDDGYHAGIDYHLAIEAVGNRLRVFVDGVQVVEATDGYHSAGTIALYAGENQGARFSDVRVDDLRPTAPVTYRFEFTTSRFTDFRHHLHSYPDVTFRTDLADLNGVAASFGAAIELASSSAGQQPSEAEARAFEQLALKALESASTEDPPAVDVTRIDRGDQPLAYLVRTSEPIDWRRTSLEVSLAAAHNFKPESPSGPKLIEAGFAAANANDELVAVMLGDSVDLSGWRIEYRHLPSTAAPSVPDGAVLFQQVPDSLTKEFVDASTWNPPLTSLSEISVANVKGTGTPAWAVSKGEVSQTGNFFIADAPGANPPLRRGAHALLTGNFVNFRYQAQIRANAPGRIGLLFRYQDEDNYYRLSVDDKGIIELLKYGNKTGTVLASSPNGYSPVNNYTDLTVEATDNRIVIYLNDEKVFDVLDRDLVEGRLGFYTYGAPNARFTQVFVTTLTPQLGPWQVYEHPPVRSMWACDAGIMRQTVDLSVGAPPPSGSIALVGDGSWADVRIESSLVTGSAAVVAGYLFRYVDVGNHYRLIFNGVQGRRSLIRVSNGVATEIWSATGTLPPGTMAGVKIEAVGRRLRLWLDDTLLTECFDLGPVAGRVGVISIAGAPVSWGEISIRMAAPQWELWHEFTAETVRGPGRRYRVFSGLASDPIPPSTDLSEMRRFRGKLPADFHPAFPAHGVDLRLVDPSGRSGHLRRFMPATSYSAIAPRFIRAADGAGFILALRDTAAQAGCRLDPGEYRFRFTFRRDNRGIDSESLVLSQDGDQSPEIVQIDVPWRT